MNQKLVDFKNKKKAKNPRFVRQDTHKKKRITVGWRKPRGWDSKQRKRMQREAIVEPGYGSPKELRGVHKSGLEIVTVISLDVLKSVNKKTQGIIVSGKIGMRRKVAIITEAMKQEIKILNIPKPAEYLKRKEEVKEQAKKAKDVTGKKKESKEKKDKESIEDKLSEDEKKKLEKKEIDRLLTKKF